MLITICMIYYYKNLIDILCYKIYTLYYFMFSSWIYGKLAEIRFLIVLQSQISRFEVWRRERAILNYENYTWVKCRGRRDKISLVHLLLS
jgi:hypothetical protein